MAYDDSKGWLKVKEDIANLLERLPSVCPKCGREVYEWYHFEPSPKTLIGQLPDRFKESCSQEPHGSKD